MKTVQPLSIRTLPKAILHIDGDAFFASCEQAMNPELRGKPVVTGEERGIASAMSYEAKAAGVTRGMPLWQIRKVCPEAIILPSNYEAYSLYAARMYDIVRRYTPTVEEYSIDECFADITGLRRVLHKSYEQIAAAIKNDLEHELGISFSVGLAPNKVLAKIASNWNKPSGLVVIHARDAHTYLANTPVGDVWGIGRQTSSFLRKHRVMTAYDYATRSESWVHKYMSKPYQEIYEELRGSSVLQLNLEKKRVYKSITKGKTFTPSSTDRDYIFSQLSKNIENACIKARRHDLRSSTIRILLKTHGFRYHGIEFKLSREINTPMIIIDKALELFDQIYQAGVSYRATRVILKDLHYDLEQPDLFEEYIEIEKYGPIFMSVDDMNKKYGKHTLFTGSSYHAHMKTRKNGRDARPLRQTTHLLPGENQRQHINVPWLGKVV